MAAGLAALLWGCAERAAGPLPLEARRPLEGWVDAYAPAGGDGTRAAPWRTVPQPLAGGVSLHLASGVYAGPFVLADGVTLTGEGTAVLTAEAPFDVVTARAARLVDLSLQGGGVGLRVTGPTSLERVHFSGHRSAGVAVEDAGVAVLTGCVFEGAIPGTKGVWVRGGVARLDGGVMRAGYRRGVDVDEGSAEVSGTVFEGVAEAVHVVGGGAVVRGARAEGGRGPAFFVARGRLTLERAVVLGHEYGLQSGAGAVVRVDGLRVTRPQLSAVALVESDSTLHALELEATGSVGAVMILGGTATVEDARLHDVTALGVFSRNAQLTARRVTIEGVREEQGAGGPSQGDGVHVREGSADLDEVRVSDAEGAAVWVTAHARVQLGRLVAERVGVGGLVVEQSASVEGREVVVRGSRGPAVSVLEGGALELERLAASGVTGGAVWADCELGARVRLGAFDGGQRLPRCVEVRARLDGGALR